MFCVFLGNPLQFSGSQLSTFRNEQLEELFPSPYGLTKAAQPCSFLFSSGIFWREYSHEEKSFPMKKRLQRGKYVRYVFLVIIFRTVWSTENCKRKGKWHAKSSGNLLLHLNSEKDRCVGNWALSPLGKSGRPSDGLTGSRFQVTQPFPGNWLHQTTVKLE